MNKNKVLVLVASFNRADLIIETLLSIKNQTYKDFTCFITDDNSKDVTTQVISEFCDKDERFKLFIKPSNYPQGLSATRNFGLDLAKAHNADFIQFFDDDDIMHPQKLKLQLAPFFSDKTLDMTLCAYRKFKIFDTIEFDLKKADDSSCNITTDNLLKSFYLNTLNLNSLGPIWSFKAIKDFRFNEELYYGEERDLYLRIFLMKSINYKSVPFILFWYRKHNKAITSNLYGDKSYLKKQGIVSSETSFLKLILEQKNAPFFLLKSYFRKSIINNNYVEFKKIILYVWRNYLPVL